MALYKYSEFLSKSDHQAFDQIWDPGTAPDYSGIFRCEGCGREITHIGGTRLPPQNHHQHTAAQGRIRWRMVVSHEG